MEALNPNKNAATGSVGEAATFLAASMVALFAAIGLELFAYTIAALFLVWLSGTTFTLGILEYRRSQLPAQVDHGPEV